MEISLTCPVADLQKTFIISWEQSLGVAPFEVWLPRISGLYHKKLDSIFDLPEPNGTSIAPRPCQKSRVYSMAAQEKFLKSCGGVFFFPENQHTPRSIQESLQRQSGQFYDELTAQDSESTSKTPPVGEFTPSLKNTFITLNPNKRTRTGSLSLLGKTITHLSHRPVEMMAHGEDSKNGTRKKKKTNSTEITSVEARSYEQKHLLTRNALFVLDAICRVFGRLAAPARLSKILIVIWLCFRAFDNAHIVQVERSIISSAKAAWNRWDFEPVELYGDCTGWKHLMGKVNQGATRILHDEPLGVLTSTGLESERKPEDVEIGGSNDAGSAGRESARDEEGAQTIEMSEDGSVM